MPRPAAQRDLLGRPLRRAPPAPEFHLQCMVADILNRWITPGWKFSHFPSGEHRTKTTGARLKRAGLQPGWPDLILLSPFTVAHWLELKRRGEKIKSGSSQDEFAGYCREHGYPHAVADNFDDALATLKRWGAIRSEVYPQ